VYLLAKFGILAAWIWGTWCTWWPEFGILRCFNLVYFVAVLGGFSIYLLPGDLVYLVGVLGDLVAGVWYTCSSSLFTSIAKFCDFDGCGYTFVAGC